MSLESKFYPDFSFLKKNMQFALPRIFLAFLIFKDILYENVFLLQVPNNSNSILPFMNPYKKNVLKLGMLFTLKQIPEPLKDLDAAMLLQLR